MLFILACVLVAIISVYTYYKNAFKYWEARGVQTLPASFPFGNMARVIFRLESVNDKVCEIYNRMKTNGNKYAGIYFFSRKVFLPIDLELVKCILTKDFRHFDDRGIYYDEENDPVSAHLFSLHGDKWRNLRAKLTPAFTAGKVKYMFGAILNCSDDMINVLSSEIKLDNTIEIKDILARFTTDVIGSCAFGIECNSLKNPQAEFREMGRRAFTQTPTDLAQMIVIRSFPAIAKLLRLSVFPRKVSDFFKTVVEDTIRFREERNVTRSDFLQLLIQLKNNGKLDDGDKITGDDVTALTTNEAAAQAFIFFLAGFETTSTTVSFALLEIALNSDMQERVRTELARVSSKYENKLTYDSVAELHYLETVVLESLRKYPPAPIFLRKCTKAYNVPGTDIIIEEGLSTLIPAMALHRDPDYYPQPEQFDPDRFCDANKHMIQDYAYIPFGNGPRICIGMRFAMVQSKLALAAILQNFKITLNARTKLPLKMETKGIVLAPIGGIWLDFESVDINMYKD